MTYEEYVRKELMLWEEKLNRDPSRFELMSRSISRKLNEHIPERVHQVITTGIRTMVESIRSGVRFVPKGDLRRGEHLQEMDQLADDNVTKWTQVASAEGAGTGLGGFKLSLIDFPALLSIKMKMLHDLAYVYGFDPNDRTERLFLLRIFQLEYADEKRKLDIWRSIGSWPELSDPLTQEQDEIDWQQFQQDYRDSLDFRKLLQMIPGFGAVVGAWANYGLVNDLGRTAINSYRQRVLATVQSE